MIDFLRFVTSSVTLHWRPLVDRGFGLIYDVERDITWLKDANYARTVGRTPDGQMIWNDAMTWVASLRYHGIGGWRLPTALNRDGSGPCTGENCNRSELGHLALDVWANYPNLVTYINADASAIYWLSTEASDDLAFAFEFFPIRQGTLKKNPFPDGSLGEVPLSGPVLSWPVHNGDVAGAIMSRFWQFGFRVREQRINA